MTSALQQRPVAEDTDAVPRHAKLALVDPKAGVVPLAAPAASLLRFITCGSVDDGKSTLIGRLLYETNAVFDDQLEALHRDSKKFGTTGEDLDFALLVDGLSAEREQGITIDVAYRYFSTGHRAFIIADTPGHEQYTRNMATGASQAELAVILVDARKGILPQTRRHSFITSLVGIKSVVIAINKMDLIDFAEDRFEAIKRDYEAILPALGFTDVSFVPVSAKNGDNIAARSPNLPWYRGETLLERLESVTPETFDAGSAPFRMPVQWVNRPDLDFRGFAGTIASGSITAGDPVVVLPGRRETRVKAVRDPDGEVLSAAAGGAVTLTLTDEVDVSRGDVLARPDDMLAAVKSVAAEILWMVDRPLVPGGRLVAKLGTASTPASVRGLDAAVDIHSFAPKPANVLLMNEIGRVTLAFDRPLVAASYEESREFGAFILIDPLTNETVALGVVRTVNDDREPSHSSARPGSTLDHLKTLWLGEARESTQRWSMVRFRAAAAVLFGFIGFLFGLAPVLAAALALVDFALRPFLRLAFGAHPTHSATEKGVAAVGDGAGI
ncbi:sulfate adenylyltransferase subunit CysN [Aurantimonas marina]|uniref:sulfate adenylyltransferase subunit CysN n=1 Tax=Aurantimonas marina TaxID=2780508 RepID=UPI0019D233DF|nr:sulfate adenylyltransferase subunit CysN [Aurantimonas marina]